MWIQRILFALAVATGWTLAIVRADEPLPPQWSQFRGPGGQGAAGDQAKLPVEFSPSKNVLWKTPLPLGHSSPCVWGDRVFVTAAKSEERRLITLCLDRQTGNIVWERSVSVEKFEPMHQLNCAASSTPATDGRRVYVLFGSYGLLAYDLAKQLADYSAKAQVAAVAVRLGGKGNVSDTHVAWKQTTAVPEVPSLLYHDGRVYLLSEKGILTCREAATGKELYKQRLGMEGTCYASPVVGDGKIYVASDGGTLIVFEPGDRYQRLAKNDFDEGILATPALVDGKIYLRTQGHLYAFGLPAGESE